jgi:hypothetical protein
LPPAQTPGTTPPNSNPPQGTNPPQGF